MQGVAEQYKTHAVVPTFPSIDLPPGTVRSELETAVEGLPKLMQLVLTMAITEELNVLEVALVLDMQVADVLRSYLEGGELIGAVLGVRTHPIDSVAVF
jgi:DNA-directed RNA polymerase specialized sigma24 family protein